MVVPNFVYHAPHWIFPGAAMWLLQYAGHVVCTARRSTHAILKPMHHMRSMMHNKRHKRVYKGHMAQC
jgi:hypothetical protein